MEEITLVTTEAELLEFVSNVEKYSPKDMHLIVTGLLCEDFAKACTAFAKYKTADSQGNVAWWGAAAGAAVAIATAGAALPFLLGGAVVTGAGAQRHQRNALRTLTTVKYAGLVSRLSTHGFQFLGRRYDPDRIVLGSSDTIPH